MHIRMYIYTNTGIETHTHKSKACSCCLHGHAYIPRQAGMPVHQAVSAGQILLGLHTYIH